MATTTSTSTMTDNSIATAIENHSPASLHHRKPSEPKANGNGNGHGKGSTTQRIRDTKYRHVFATHSLTRTSCLSQDSESSPSFVGFRNLMVLVLSMHSPAVLSRHS
jgi:diacylglycerol O-acyltransferase-1